MGDHRRGGGRRFAGDGRVGGAGGPDGVLRRRRRRSAHQPHRRLDADRCALVRRLRRARAVQLRVQRRVVPPHDRAVVHQPRGIPVGQRDRGDAHARRRARRGARGDVGLQRPGLDDRRGDRRSRRRGPRPGRRPRRLAEPADERRRRLLRPPGAVEHQHVPRVQRAARRGRRGVRRLPAGRRLGDVLERRVGVVRGRRRAPHRSWGRRRHDVHRRHGRAGARRRGRQPGGGAVDGARAGRRGRDRRRRCRRR